jgi:hypothetical protein
LSVMEARGAVKRRLLINEPGGQASVRSRARGHPHRGRRARAGPYRSAGGRERLLPGASFRRLVIKCRAWHPQLTDIPSGL